MLGAGEDRLHGLAGHNVFHHEVAAAEAGGAAVAACMRGGGKSRGKTPSKDLENIVRIVTVERNVAWITGGCKGA